MKFSQFVDFKHLFANQVHTFYVSHHPGKILYPPLLSFFDNLFKDILPL